MNKKDMFIAMVEELIGDFNRKTEVGSVEENYAEALAYFNAFKTSVETKEKVQFTDNGKLILKTMLENLDDKQNMFKAREIAEMAFISSRSVSGSIRKLVTDGYVEKIGADPIIYAVTDMGKEVVIDGDN